MKLNEKIKEYRKIFNLSQEQLAEKLSVSRQVITKWENDEGLPEIGNLKAISKIMGISIDYLLDETKKLEEAIKPLKIENKAFPTVLLPVLFSPAITVIPAISMDADSNLPIFFRESCIKNPSVLVRTCFAFSPKMAYYRKILL